MQNWERHKQFKNLTEILDSAKDLKKTTLFGERVIQFSHANIRHAMEAYTSLGMFGSRTKPSDEVGFSCNCYYATISPSVSCLTQTILSIKYNANWCYEFLAHSQDFL